MATRYSGDLVINVLWIDDTNVARREHFHHGGYYKASVSHKGKNLWRGRIGAPASLSHAVDSPRAYDGTAHAAISFANESDSDVGNAGATRDGGSWIIGRDFKSRWGRAESKSGGKHHSPGTLTAGSPAYYDAHGPIGVVPVKIVQVLRAGAGHSSESRVLVESTSKTNRYMPAGKRFEASGLNVFPRGHLLKRKYGSRISGTPYRIE